MLHDKCLTRIASEGRTCFAEPTVTIAARNYCDRHRPDRPDSEHGGRGFGPYVKGKQIMDVSELLVGSLVLMYSPQFHTDNTVLITREFEQRVWGCFVDPDDWQHKDGHEFCIWDFDIEFGTHVLWKAVDPNKPLEMQQ